MGVLVHTWSPSAWETEKQQVFTPGTEAVSNNPPGGYGDLNAEPLCRSEAAYRVTCDSRARWVRNQGTRNKI